MGENREKDYELEANFKKYNSIWTEEEQEISKTKSLSERPVEKPIETALDTPSNSSTTNSTNSDDMNVWLVLGKFIMGVIIIIASINNFHPYVIDGKIQIIDATDIEYGTFINLLAGITIFAFINAIAIFIITKNLTFVSGIAALFMLAGLIYAFILGFQLNSIIVFGISCFLLYLGTQAVRYREYIAIFIILLGIWLLPSEYALTWTFFLSGVLANMIYVVLFKLNNNQLL